MKAKTLAYICNHKDGHVKLFMEEPASPMWESSDLVLRHEAQAEIDALKAENARLDDVAYRAESYKYRIHAMQDEIAMLRELPAKMLEESAKMLSLQGPPPIHITVSQLPEWIKEVK